MPDDPAPITRAKRRRAHRLGTIAWCTLGMVLLLPAALVFSSPAASAVLAWQPELWATQPWRAWSAAWVHLSRMHLGANLAGGALVIALGAAAAMPLRAALAWAFAWPLTQLGLLVVPTLQRYGGLSGVLHAGVAVVMVSLLRSQHQAERRLGGAIGAVLLLKLVSEAAWRGPLAHPAGWDIAIAPAAHVSGVVCGAVVAWLLVPARQGLGRTRPD